MSSLRDELQAIYDQYGKLTPELVVNEARREDHPLHSKFEWDNDTASEKWRKHQASELIRSVKVVYRPATEKEVARSVRAWHSTPDNDGRVYRPVEEVKDDPFIRKLILADMEREWKALHRRYANFAEFMEMVRKDIEADAA